jgi:hypothetical protein
MRILVELPGIDINAQSLVLYPFRLQLSLGRRDSYLQSSTIFSEDGNDNIVEKEGRCAYSKQ